MAHQRQNPSALQDPKVSIVIPVYNEKSTIDEILRRVLDTEARKELIIVDDFSTGGTRQILGNIAARQGKGGEFSPGRGWNDRRERRGLRVFFPAPDKGKGGGFRIGFSR